MIGTYIFFKFCRALRTMLIKGEGDVTPWFRPHGIKIVDDVNIVLNHGKELKAKALPLIWCFVYRRSRLMLMGIMLS